MGWFTERKEKIERKKRLERLSDEELEQLATEEKQAYLGVAMNMVNRRGRLNAIKDFPVPNDQGEQITLEEHDREIIEQEEEDV